MACYRNGHRCGINDCRCACLQCGEASDSDDSRSLDDTCVRASILTSSTARASSTASAGTSAAGPNAGGEVPSDTSARQSSLAPPISRKRSAPAAASACIVKASAGTSAAGHDEGDEVPSADDSSARPSSLAPPISRKRSAPAAASVCIVKASAGTSAAGHDAGDEVPSAADSSARPSSLAPPISLPRGGRITAPIVETFAVSTAEGGISGAFAVNDDDSDIPGLFDRITQSRNIRNGVVAAPRRAAPPPAYRIIDLTGDKAIDDNITFGSQCYQYIDEYVGHDPQQRDDPLYSPELGDGELLQAVVYQDAIEENYLLNWRVSAKKMLQERLSNAQFKKLVSSLQLWIKNTQTMTSRPPSVPRVTLVHTAQDTSGESFKTAMAQPRASASPLLHSAESPAVGAQSSGEESQVMATTPASTSTTMAQPRASASPLLHSAESPAVGAQSSGEESQVIATTPASTTPGGSLV